MGGQAEEGWVAEVRAAVVRVGATAVAMVEAAMEAATEVEARVVARAAVAMAAAKAEVVKVGEAMEVAKEVGTAVVDLGEAKG